MVKVNAINRYLLTIQRATQRINGKKIQACWRAVVEELKRLIVHAPMH